MGISGPLHSGLPESISLGKENIPADSNKPKRASGVMKRLSGRITALSGRSSPPAKASSSSLRALGDDIISARRPSRENVAPKLPVDGVPRAAINHGDPVTLPGGMAEMALREQGSEHAISSQGRGEVFTDTFRYEGQELLRETATRADVVSVLVKGNKDRIEHLKAEIRQVGQQEPVDHVKLQKLMLQLDISSKLQQRVETAQSQERTWASSASYRKLLESSNTVESANQQYIPACVNLRTQVVETPAGTVASSLNRSGAVSDYRNGATNLQEMKDFKLFLGAVKSWNQLSEANRQTLQNVLPEAKDPEFMNSHSPQQAAAILDNAIVDRELVLENQALQDLSAHFSAIEARGIPLSEHLAGSESVVLGRVSMLDGIKDPVVGEFVLNEKNQMLDMKAIYSTLNGKELVFDGKGPYIDTEGAVHLPFFVRNAEGQVVTKPLNAIFFNISAQGNIQNEGPQQEINRDAMKQMKDLVNATARQLIAEGNHDKAAAIMEKYVQLNKALEAGVEDGFESAQNAMDLLHDCQSLISINCFSGKDRTGLLAAMATFRELEDSVEGLGLSEGQKKAVLAKFGRQLLGGDGIACLVVADNTGHRALKLSVAKLQLLLANDENRVDFLLGCGRRVEMYGKAGATFLDAVKGEPSLEDRGSGQLHVG